MSNDKKNFIQGNNANTNTPSLTGRGTTTVKRDYFSERGTSSNSSEVKINKNMNKQDK